MAAKTRGCYRLILPPPGRVRETEGSSAPAIRYLKSLGVTAVELLPAHHFLQDRHLVEQGLSNYWGYSPVSFFAPHTGYSVDREPMAAVREFRDILRGQRFLPGGRIQSAMGSIRQATPYNCFVMETIDDDVASRASDFVNGQIIFVDGGAHLRSYERDFMHL